MAVTGRGRYPTQLAFWRHLSQTRRGATGIIKAIQFGDADSADQTAKTDFLFPLFTLGVDFRASSPYVVDQLNHTYSLAASYADPHYSAANFGWTDGLGGDRTRDRDSALDPRLAGCNFTNPSAAQDNQLIFRIDLPAAGTYTIRLALGDSGGFTHTNLRCEILDNTTSKLVLTAASVTGGHYIDATGVDRISASDWVTNNASTDIAFATTTLIVKIGTLNTATDRTDIAHFFVQTSQNALNAYTLTAALGTFTETGNAANLLVGHRLTAATGTFTETGKAANLLHGYPLTAVKGTFNLTGNAANLLVAHVLTAVKGTFALTGNAANLLVAHRLTAAAGSFVINGNAATLSKGDRLTAATGTFTLTGNAATLTVARVLTSLKGSYVLTGNAAAQLTAHRLTAGTGTFSLTGNAANLVYAAAGFLPAGAGSFALTGNPATLTYAPGIPVSSPTVSPQSAGGGDDDGAFAVATPRVLGPVPEKTKRPYLETVKELSKETEAKPTPKRSPGNRPPTAEPFTPPKRAPKQSGEPATRPTIPPSAFESYRLPQLTEAEIAAREARDAALRQAEQSARQSAQELEHFTRMARQVLQHAAIEAARRKQDEDEAMIAVSLLLN